jgi:ADP-heptose:LPS heptosyltransferase
MKIAVVKPDHFGDLILSSAAIRAVLARYPDASVLVAPRNLPLGRFLFGEACDLREITLPHLSKHREEQQSACVDLRDYDLVLFLRNDGRLGPAWADLRCRDYVFPVDTHDDHQTMLDYAVVSGVIGDYNIDAHHYGTDPAAVRQKVSRAPARIGLSIGSGFHANAWPVVRWIELGRRLLAEGRQVRVFCGPSEVVVGRMVAGVLGLGGGGVVVGDERIEAFAREAAEMDWFVASDGGTAHLCGLFAPVTSIFGPSPFRRYAPFGRWNRLLTQELDCSPCCQWTAKLVNGCLSTECMVNIGVEQVMAGLGPPYATDIEPGAEDAGGGCRLYYGVSHLGIADKIEERLAA